MRLKTDEYFTAIALFEPDPKLEDNPGYFEYYDHWDEQANQYVPCTGEKCPFCAANINPSIRALTTWYYPQNDPKDRLKIFTMNNSTIQAISDEAEMEGGLLGKTVRVKRLSDKGDYRVRTAPGKALSKTEVKKAMTEIEERFPKGVRDLVEKMLASQMQRLKALEALDDQDDDDDEDEQPIAKKGKKADVIEGVVFIILMVSRKNNTITVEHEDEQ